MRTILLLLTFCWSLSAAAAPRVVTSILPLHSLVSGVMEGVGSPTLLIGANASPHAYALKPSDARALSEAELMVWVGEGFEKTVLARPLHSLAGKARVLKLASLESMQLLSVREPGIRDDHADEHEGHAHKEGDIDPHLWLSPHNARLIVDAVATELASLDMANAGRYRANAAELVSRISALEKSLQAQLAPVSGRPFIVFHDAYRYFEEAIALHSAGAIAVDPERRPGARRLIEIRQAIHDRGAVCVFSEPQFRPDIVEVVLEGSSARHGVLDPLGAALAPGKEQWFGLMQGLADNLVACLSGDSN